MEYERFDPNEYAPWYVTHTDMEASVWPIMEHGMQRGERMVVTSSEDEPALPLCVEVTVSFQTKGFAATVTPPYSPDNPSEPGTQSTSYEYKSRHEVSADERHRIICLMAQVILEESSRG